MGHAIIKLDGLYLVWSSIVDAPITFGMTRDEFEGYYQEEHGLAGMRGLPHRMARVEARGTSAHDDLDVDDTIWLNRAGPAEISLNKAEIIEWFCRRKRHPTMKEIKSHRATLPKCSPCMWAKQCCPCWGSGVRE